MQGFRDGYHGIEDRAVSNHNRYYEQGYVSGAFERMQLKERAKCESKQ